MGGSSLGMALGLAAALPLFIAVQTHFFVPSAWGRGHSGGLDRFEGLVRLGEYSCASMNITLLGLTCGNLGRVNGLMGSVALVV